jgi:membrane protease YdiL (CAAX protease family)
MSSRDQWSRLFVLRSQCQEERETASNGGSAALHWPASQPTLCVGFECSVARHIDFNIPQPADGPAVPVDSANLLPVLVSAASLAVWVWVLLRWRAGDPPLAFRERPDVSLDLMVVLAVLVIWQIVPVLVAGGIQLTSSPWLHQVQKICIAGALTLTGAACALFGNRTHRPHELGIGLQNGLSDLRDGGLGFLAAFLPVALMLFATSSLRNKENAHSLLKLLREHSDLQTVGWVVLSAVVIAPLVEELAFRVILQGTLTKQIGPRWSIPLVALAFSAVHPWLDALALIPLALVLGYVYHRRHSYLAVVVLHAIFNATNLIFALLTAENPPAGS